MSDQTAASQASLELRKKGYLRLFTARFRRGAIVYAFGTEDEERQLQRIGLKILREAIMILDDYGTDGRLALVPMLDDPEPGARVSAAHYLLDLMPERALAVLRAVRDSQECGRTSFNAAILISSYEDGTLKLR